MPSGDREKWNERYRAAGPLPAPSPFLDACDALLPRSGRGLDLAGGTGRHSLWMARRGLAVTLAEVSEVALARAQEAARADGLSLAAAQVDLEAQPLPAGPWALIVCAYFLHRPLFAAAAAALSPGGYLAVIHPTLRNLERNPKPGAAFLLNEGELLGLATGLATGFATGFATGLATGLELVRCDEAWRPGGQHEAWLLARRAF